MQDYHDHYWTNALFAWRYPLSVTLVRYPVSDQHQVHLGMLTQQVRGRTKEARVWFDASARQYVVGEHRFDSWKDALQYSHRFVTVRSLLEVD